jgi:menaquinone-dependent protoporphyrinogen IX oxidase
MENSNQKALVVYSSPAGTTRHVAQVITQTLKDLGCQPRVSDLGNKIDLKKLSSEKSIGSGLET